MLSKLYPQVMQSFIHEKTCFSPIGSSHSLKCFLEKNFMSFLLKSEREIHLKFTPAAKTTTAHARTIHRASCITKNNLRLKGELYQTCLWGTQGQRLLSKIRICSGCWSTCFACNPMVSGSLLGQTTPQSLVNEPWSLSEHSPDDHTHWCIANKQKNHLT